jgi:hypothetical protein
MNRPSRSDELLMSLGWERSERLIKAQPMNNEQANQSEKLRIRELLWHKNSEAINILLNRNDQP